MEPFWRLLFCSGARSGHSAGRITKLLLQRQVSVHGSRLISSCCGFIFLFQLFRQLLSEFFLMMYSRDCFTIFQTVAIMLILFGIAFIVIETRHNGKSAKINSLVDISYTTALMIGFFQLIAAIFPGTSRSGATIVGALLIGVSRTVAAEYTFFPCYSGYVWCESSEAC